MANSSDFDASDYVRPPALSVASAIALTSALLHAFPRHAPPAAKTAAKTLRAAGVTLQEQWKEADRRTRPEDPRPADRAIDNAWAALHARLDAWLTLDPSRVPEVDRARTLSESLFPDGLAFLKKPYAEEWAESDKRLHRITEEKLEKELDALVGKVFLAEVRAAHAHYGKVIGATATRAANASVDLQEPLRAVARAIAAYAVQIVAAAQAGDAHARELLAALAPIAEHRQATSRRKGRAAAQTEPATPETPLPQP